MLLLLLLFYCWFWCDNIISIDVIYLCCASVSTHSVICAAVSSTMRHRTAVSRNITVNISMYSESDEIGDFMCNACLLIFISVFVTGVYSISV